MRLIVPYANNLSDPEVHYCVRLNLAILGVEAEWVRMREPNDYSLLINRLWADGEPFILHEHDVIVWRGAIEEIVTCPEPFCGYDGTLQCAKVTPAGACPVSPRTSWTVMDKELHDGLYARGVGFHDHVGRAPVVNLNRGNVLIPIADPVRGA